MTRATLVAALCAAWLATPTAAEAKDAQLSGYDAITRMGRAMNCSIFVVNGPIYSGLGAGGEGFTSFSIASPTGEGLTRPRTFSRERRLTIVGSLRIV